MTGMDTSDSDSDSDSSTVGIEDVKRHDRVGSCWVVLRGRVYDLTAFLPNHPGGAHPILKYAGGDITRAFEGVHGYETLQRVVDLPDGGVRLVGVLEGGSEQEEKMKTKDELRVEEARKRRPPLGRVLNLEDMENVAKSVTPAKVYAFWASGADDEITLKENTQAFSRYFFVPRVLRAVGTCDPSVIIQGTRSRLPFYASATSLGRLAHPRAETNVTRAAGKTGIIQMTSTHTSSTPEELIRARTNEAQPIWFQLYKKADDVLAGGLVARVEALGFRALCLTVDVASHGNRETDLRTQFLEEGAKGTEEEEEREEEDTDHDGTSGALLKGDDSDMSWEKTIPWLRSVTRLPIIIKGIQCVEDAVEAVNAGVDGIIVSNHGGRQMEYSLPSIDVLYQIRLQRPDVFERIEVYVDGGVRRGTDILKALCMGAKAVGIGRPFLYANGSYGEAGVLKVIRILEKEVVTGMRLLGARTVEDLKPEMVQYMDFKSKL